MAHIDVSPANILEVGTAFRKSKTLLSAVSLDVASVPHTAESA